MTIQHQAPEKKQKKICWIVTEGLAGTENQCIGVAQALGVDVEIKRIRLNQPWKTLSPYLGFEGNLTFSPALLPPWPDLLLTGGRKSIAAARFIKRQSGEKTISVHLQDPRVSPHHFDLIAVPAHDTLRADNVIVTNAAPNRINTVMLEHGRRQFPHLGQLPGPRVAVLIGGNSKAYRMTRPIVENIVRKLDALSPASLMVTCSRRTGAEFKTYIETNLSAPTNYIWDGTGENPYLAMLGWADVIIATADSVSMISESCTTGKPVYMINLKGGSKRITAFHERLMERGALKWFGDDIEPFTYEPLEDAKTVAEAIKNRFPLFTE
jgi:uncharacterized protein